MLQVGFEPAISADRTATGTDTGFIVIEINFKIGSGIFVEFVNSKITETRKISRKLTNFFKFRLSLYSKLSEKTVEIVWIKQLWANL